MFADANRFDARQRRKLLVQLAVENTPHLGHVFFMFAIIVFIPGKLKFNPDEVLQD